MVLEWFREEIGLAERDLRGGGNFGCLFGPYHGVVGGLAFVWPRAQIGRCWGSMRGALPMDCRCSYDFYFFNVSIYSGKGLSKPLSGLVRGDLHARTCWGLLA